MSARHQSLTTQYVPNHHAWIPILMSGYFLCSAQTPTVGTYRTSVAGRQCIGTLQRLGRIKQVSRSAFVACKRPRTVTVHLTQQDPTVLAKDLVRKQSSFDRSMVEKTFFHRTAPFGNALLAQYRQLPLIDMTDGMCQTSPATEKTKSLADHKGRLRRSSFPFGQDNSPRFHADSSYVGRGFGAAHPCSIKTRPKC
jgi:hypothetical protein